MAKSKRNPRTVPAPVLSPRADMPKGNACSTIPRSQLINLCSRIDDLYSMYDRGCALQDRGEPVDASNDGINIMLCVVNEDLAACDTRMQQVSADTPEKVAVATALADVKQCCKALTLLPAGATPDDIDGLFVAAAIGGKRLQAAIQAVPVLPTVKWIEAIEHPTPEPWRPTLPDNEPPRGKPGRKRRDDDLYEEAGKLEKENPGETWQQILGRLRKKLPKHPFFEGKSRKQQYDDFRAGLSRLRRPKPNGDE